MAKGIRALLVHMAYSPPSSPYKSKFSTKSKAIRLLWDCVYLILFRPTPRWILNSWRIFLLRLFGATIGKQGRIDPSCKIWAPWNFSAGDCMNIGTHVDCYSISPIQLGNRVTISQRSFLCTGSHDITSLKTPLIHKPITIGDHVWVCAEAFVGPGISIGEGAIVGARSVVIKDVDAWNVVAGNPAKTIKIRTILT